MKALLLVLVLLSFRECVGQSNLKLNQEQYYVIPPVMKLVAYPLCKIKIQLSFRIELIPKQSSTDCYLVIISDPSFLCE